MTTSSFGGLIRTSRQRAGLTQARLGELVGRTPSTVRSWERDRSTPTDPSVLASLAAVLGIDEATLFVAAGLEPPARPTAPTIEQQLAEIGPVAPVQPLPRIEEAFSGSRPAERGRHTSDPGPRQLRPAERPSPPAPTVVDAPVPAALDLEPEDALAFDIPKIIERIRWLFSGRRVAQPERTPIEVEPSYVELPAERRRYEMRAIITAVLLVVLFVVFLWAVRHLGSAVAESWRALTSGFGPGG